MRLGTLTIRGALIAASLMLGVAATPPTTPGHTIAGDYLIAHAAEHAGDWKTAGTLLTRLWQQTRDPDTLRQAFLISLGAGNTDEALRLAHEIKPDMAESAIAAALLASDAIKKNDLAAAATQLDTLPPYGISVPLKAILGAWIDAAQGKHADAMAKLDGLKQFDSYRTLHTALIDEFMDDRKTADADYAAIARDKPLPRVASIVADYYRRTNRPQMAATIIDGLSTKENLAAISVTASQGNGRENPGIISGSAEGFYNMAELLLEANHPDIGLFYAEIANNLEPAKPDTNLLIGEIEQAEGRHLQAAQSFLAVPEKADFGLLAHLDAALAFEQAGHADKAIIVSQDLAKSYPALPEPLIALGDLLRRQKQPAKAVEAYGRALGIVKTDDAIRTDILFARAITYDQMSKDKLAEADLRAATTLGPERATILNYLGFFWASRDENLTEAHAMLDHAYKIAPTDGAIADSLGWVSYQMGDYKNAVTYLEQAVALLPGDSEINGHLGDAYWRVGRINDARFQWRHALLNASTTTAPEFKAKLINGIIDTGKPATPIENHAALDTMQ